MVEEKIERYIFGEPGRLNVGLPGSVIRCDRPVGVGGSGSMIVDERGERLQDENGSVLSESVAGEPIILVLRFNGDDVGTARFDPGSLNGTLSFPTQIRPKPGDLLELTGGTLADPDLADLVWTFVVS